MTVWITTENIRVGGDSYIRGVIGVFATEEDAVAACENPGDMVGPMILGNSISENQLWVGAYYPVAIKMGLV